MNLKKVQSKSKNRLGFRSSRLLKLFGIVVTSGILATLIGFILPKIFPSNSPPKSEISVNRKNGHIPFSVQFDGAKSFDPEGEFLEYYWYIDDELVSNKINFTHHFLKPTEYKIQLTVKDPIGLQGNDVIFVKALRKKSQILNNNQAISNNSYRNISFSSDSNSIFYNLSHYKNIPEEQIRRDISDYLKNDNVDDAIGILKYFDSGEAKDEECMVIFNYCISNNKLEKAKLAIGNFQSDSLRTVADEILSFEILKNN